MTRKERFESQVLKMPTCWLWKGPPRKRGGYGQFNWGDGKVVSAHKASYLLFVGEVPEGMDLDHTCRNRMCVNPEHLEPVTRKVNLNRGLNGVLKEFCKNGLHPWIEENKMKPNKQDKSRCRPCHLEWRRVHGC